MPSGDLRDAGLSFADLPFADLLKVSAMALATVDAQGRAHAAPVYFAAGEQLRLYFFSDPESRHGQDLSRNPHAAAAIYPECSSWQEIRGLQLHGAVQLLPPGSDWEAGWACYSAKFPFVVELKEIVARNALYVFKPSWVRLVDNRQGFGFKQEWTLP
jgi:uncharacterized protein YhbP (UPF0306 family)